MDTIPRGAIVVGCLGAVSASSAVAAEAAPGASLLRPEIGTVFWTLVTFLVLLVLLRRYAWGPLTEALEQRERTIRESLEQAERERQEARRLLEEHRRLVTQIQRERAQALSEARRDAERLRDELLDQAQRQREQLLHQAELQIQSEMRQARAELRRVAADLAVAAAEKLLRRSLDDATHRKLVEDYLDELERMPGETRATAS